MASYCYEPIYYTTIILVLALFTVSILLTIYLSN